LSIYNLSVCDSQSKSATDNAANNTVADIVFPEIVKLVAVVSIGLDV